MDKISYGNSLLMHYGNIKKIFFENRSREHQFKSRSNHARDVGKILKSTNIYQL